jgi:hypothetical protein
VAAPVAPVLEDVTAETDENADDAMRRPTAAADQLTAALPSARRAESVVGPVPVAEAARGRGPTHICTRSRSVARTERSWLDWKSTADCWIFMSAFSARFSRNPTIYFACADFIFCGNCRTMPML